MGHLRLLPAHEGCLLAGGRLRRRRRVASATASRCTWSRPAATPISTSRSRRSRTAWRPARRRSIIGAISADGLNNLVKEIRGKNIPVIDVINGISSPELSAKSLVSFGEMGSKAGEYHRQAASQGQRRGQGRLVPRPAGRRLGRGRQQGLPRRDQGQRHRGRRDQIWRHRQGNAAEAGRGCARGPSRHQLHRRHLADRRGRRRPAARPRARRTRSRCSPTTSRPASIRASRTAASWRRRPTRR